MILVIGEILMDLIGNQYDSSLKLEGKLGGAPFNVASDLSDLGVDIVFHGIVGRDMVGDFLLEQCYRSNKNLRFSIMRRENRQTTIAFFLKERNSFQFLRKLGADFDFSEDELLSLPYNDANIIHFGSLFLSDKNARDIIFKTIKTYKESEKLISFDVNFRTDIFDDSEDYRSYYKNMISLCDIIKLTKDELTVLTGDKSIEDGISLLGEHKLVLITDGENGSYAWYKGCLYHAKADKVIPVDTIGCGDSFMAGALSYLDKAGINNLTKFDIINILRRGNACGKKTCLVSGALHGYSSLKDIEE